MIPAWAAGRKSHLSLSKFPSKSQLWLGPIEIPRTSRCQNKCFSRLLWSCLHWVFKNSLTKVLWSWQYFQWMIRLGGVKGWKQQFLASSTAHIISYYLRQVSPGTVPQNTSWRAVVSCATGHRERKARWNNYSVKSLACNEEHNTNKGCEQMLIGEKNMYVKNETRESQFLHVMFG